METDEIPKVKIVVKVFKGTVQEISSSEPNVTVEVIDFDSMEEEPEMRVWNFPMRETFKLDPENRCDKAFIQAGGSSIEV